MSTTKVSDATYHNEVIAHTGTVLVYFTAPYCSPCKALKPVVESLCDAKFVKLAVVDVSEGHDMAQSLEVRTLPTMLLYKNGVIKGSLVGAQPRGRIEALLGD